MGAYSKGETDTRVNEAKELANTANQNAANANNNANTRLEKNQNGADIPNKPKFVENLGLAETKNQAQNALPRSGGEVTGDITISTDSEISWRRNTDMAAIGFKNTGDGDTDSYMWFKTADNGNEYFKWQHSLSRGGTNEWMSLKSDNLRVKGHSVYHEGNKPTAGEVGAVSASGGVYNQSFDFKAINTQNLHLKYDKDKHNYISWYEDAERSAYLGFPSDNVKYFNIANEKLNSILTLHADSVTHNSRKLAFQDENYTKSESDNRFIRLNTSTKTSGYILSKTANYLEDTNARHLGRSGFLRPNGVDNLGSLAIHVAHPSVEKAQHSRGISFSYGSSGDDRFRISTYAFDENGKFQGQKRILTEDDLASTRNTTKKEPNGWWKCGDTGLIIQWGKWNNPYKTNDLGGHNGIPHGTNFTQNFAIPFSNMCFNIMPNITNSDTRDNINSPTIIIHSFDKNKFIFQTGEHWSIVQNSSIYWLAIGY
ncbi:gp53-like domain-containing protein [Xenorhabdus bovienii]|uniref:gp53-like domain-containing protein n=1 Tax=Xenorhabdus bovienii TaxID=40576 RepID=UPI003BB54046